MRGILAAALVLLAWGAPVWGGGCSRGTLEDYNDITEVPPGLLDETAALCRDKATSAILEWNEIRKDDPKAAKKRGASRAQLGLAMEVLGAVNGLKDDGGYMKLKAPRKPVAALTPAGDAARSFEVPTQESPVAYMQELINIKAEMNRISNQTAPAARPKRDKGDKPADGDKPRSADERRGADSFSSAARDGADAMVAEANLRKNSPPAAITAVADQYKAAGLSEDALRKYDDSLKAGGRDASGAPKSSDYTEVGKQLLDQDDPGLARKALDRAVELDPKNPDAYSVRAQIRAAAGDKEGAVADARAAMRLDPKNDLARLILGHAEEIGRAGSKSRFGSPAFGAVGEAGDAGGGRPGAGAFGPGDAGKAQTTGSPGPPGPAAAAPTTFQQFVLQKIRTKLGVGDLTGALLEASRAIDADPKNAAAWALRAEISNRLKNWEGAVKDATEALRLDPQNAAALRERAYANIQLGNYQAALEDLDKAVTLEPSNNAFATSLGWTLARDGQYQASFELFCHTVGEARAHYNLARMAEHLGQRDVSRQYLEAALRVEPNLADAQQMLTQMNGDGGVKAVQFETPR